jgi:hypothetical protein
VPQAHGRWPLKKLGSFPWQDLDGLAILVSLSPAGQKNRHTQSTQSCLDAIFLGQIEPELKKTKWNKIPDFLSLFLVNRTRT